MKFITLIFTTICFLAFAEVQAVMGNQPAFPIVVESGDDPPDCTQAYTYEHIEIVSIEARCLTCATELASDCFMNTTTPNGIDSGPLTFQEPLQILLERNAAFGYRCFVSAGGVGRPSRCLHRIVNYTTASHNESTELRPKGKRKL